MILILLIFFIYSVTENSSSLKPVIVNTKCGPIKGQAIAVSSGETVNVFKSIRYGKPPTGSQRFKKAELYRWNGTFDSTQMGPICWQPVEFNHVSYKDMSEDCLLMNIWSKKVDPKKVQMPVMVWIHGGGFINGGINSFYNQLYNGQVLATHDVVVVAINYRLHNLGFLFGNSLEAPGNVGLYDQVLALKWVQDNIAAFGGDPNQVTIFGESAGSFSVGFHLVSPLSKNLFQRAIMQSGSPYIFGNKTDVKLIMSMTKQLARQLNCSDDDNKVMIECLKKVDPKLLIASNILPTPIIGSDEFNPIPARRAMQSGHYNPIKGLLVGVTDDESSGPIKSMFQSRNLDKNAVRQYTSYFKNLVDTDKLFNHYFGHLTDKQWSDQILLRQLLSNLVSDLSMNCPTYLQAADYANHSIYNNVMFYILSYKSKWFAEFKDCNDTWQRVCHEQDLAFVMGMPFIGTANSSWTQQDRVMSALIMYYWTNFAKTGNPFSSRPTTILKSVKNLEIWPNITWFKYQPHLGVRPIVMRLHPENVSYFVDPWKRNCDDFWSKIIS